MVGSRLLLISFVDFFVRRVLSATRELIRANLDNLRNDAHHWAAVCTTDGKIAGIVTVTTMLYVEWATWRDWRSLCGAGVVVESAFTYSSHTWLHVLSRSTG